MHTEKQTATLPATGFVRLKQVLRVFPVGKTKWYAGVKSGEYPRPVALGLRTSAYRVEDIRALIERLGTQAPAGEE
jgi:predicted DNA-binding transcriptional regulator AlpA